MIPGKDVTIENLVYYQTKPTSSKLFHTQTFIQRVSLLFVKAALWNRAGHYIFALCGFYLLSFFLSFFLISWPNLSGRELDVYHTSTHGVALVRI